MRQVAAANDTPSEGAEPKAHSLSNEAQRLPNQ